MYHSFLIHTFTDGHLAHSQHLGTVNYAAVNLGVHRFFWIGVSGQNQGGGWRWGREVGSAGVGWRDGEKRHTTVIE